MKPGHEKILREALHRQGEEIAEPLPSAPPGKTPGQVRDAKLFARAVRKFLGNNLKAARRLRKRSRAKHREES